MAEKEYKLCIESANENDQLPIQALAYEKLAKIQTNTNEKTKKYFTKSIKLFEEWGAIGKANLIFKK